ncbi:hypothetical protein EVAR_97500_1 [Eumeta japonica]|uniref:Uncharacterized protein n=1 Tax=Eumeta variegata TaxID=151549 RepID=A0A4C1WMF4_EUMVA|nr:hypothetical protein EVAR_97500_1 [Eumeta japonica]
MDSESAQNQTTAILRTLDEWGLSRYVKAMCFDTTAVNTGPNVPIFGRFKKKWDEIDKTNYKAGIEDSKVANVVLSKKNEISSFITQCLQKALLLTAAREGAADVVFR